MFFQTLVALLHFVHHVFRLKAKRDKTDLFIVDENIVDFKILVAFCFNCYFYLFATKTLLLSIF